MSTLYTVDDLKDINMKCPDENEYKDPVNMFDENGKCLYAYVTLVMLGDLYISAALVLAHSLIKLGSKADKVVLVTSDVSDSGKDMLRMYFDRVIEVDYVNINNWRVPKQPHRKYLNYVFTKFRLFNLVEYKKVLLIDADAVVLKYPDHLFSLKAPAGVYLSDKDKIITYDRNGNYVLPDNKQIQWYKEFCDCCSHGSLIPRHFTDQVTKNKRNSGIGGGLMLLEPKLGELESIMSDISKGKGWYLVNRFFVWPEQQYLAYRYSGKWHSINPRFFGLQGYPHWKVLYGLQYGGDKPFVTISKMKMEERISYPDYILWHDLYYEIIKDHPNFKKSEVLAEANAMAENFNDAKEVKLSREVYQKYTHEESISHKLKIDIKEVHKDQIDYCYTDPRKPYSASGYKNPFAIYSPYKYLELMEKIMIKYKKMDSTYYSDLFEILKKDNKTDNLYTKNRTMINEFKIDDKYKEIIAYDVIRSCPKGFVITVWPLISNNINKIIDFLNKDGNVYYHKFVDMSHRQIRNLMFYMYDEFTIKERYKFIDEKMEYAKISTKGLNKVGFIYYDNVNDKRLSGQGSYYKKEIRNFALSLLESKGEFRGNDLIHVNDYFSQTIEYAQMTLNKNTLDFLNHQRLDRMKDYRYETFFMRFNTIRKWAYTNLTQNQISQICFMGGAIWFTYGVRSSNDLDCIIVNVHDNDKKFEDLIFHHFVNEKTKFPFGDMGLEDSSHWNPKWSKKNQEILDIIKVPNFDEITLNPDHHYYYGGFKFYKPEYEIVRKMIRIRPQDLADFMMLFLYFKDIVDDKLQLDNLNKFIVPSYGGNIWKTENTFKRCLQLMKERYTYDDTKNITIEVIKQMFS